MNEQRLCSPIPLRRTLVGVGVVLLGAFLSSLSSRLGVVGLADLRASTGLGSDEGAWIPTSFGAAQMFMALIAIWLGRIVSMRHLLVAGFVIFGIAEALLPLAQDLPSLLVLEIAAGVGSGVFFPVTIAYLVGSLPRAGLPFGLAAYAFNLALSTNVAATMEGWYAEHDAWAWIYWQNGVVAALAIPLVLYGVGAAPHDVKAARTLDRMGLLAGAAGLSAFYIVLDQGERVDWFGSEWLLVLAIAGFAAMAAVTIRRTLSRQAGFDVLILAQRNLLLILLIVATSRSLISANGFLIQQFLIAVQGHRPFQFGIVFLWLVAPQVVVAPLIASLLPRSNARAAMAVGLVVVLTGFWLAQGITPGWQEDDFQASQLMQGIGQSILLTSTLWFAVGHLRPANMLSFGAFLQIARLLGGEFGGMILQISNRKANDLAASALGTHLSSGDHGVAERLQHLGQTLAPHLGTSAEHGSLAILAHGVHMQVMTLGSAEAFRVCFVVGLFELVLIGLLRRPASRDSDP